MLPVASRPYYTILKHTAGNRLTDLNGLVTIVVKPQTYVSWRYRLAVHFNMALYRGVEPTLSGLKVQRPNR